MERGCRYREWNGDGGWGLEMGMGMEKRGCMDENGRCMVEMKDDRGD